MARKWLWAGGAMAGILLGVWQAQTRRQEQPVLFEPTVRQIEAAPLCPWREPEADLRQFFPPGSTYVSETRILSGFRMELTQRLGRAPDPEENALSLHRIMTGPEKAGFVLTRRVKGEHGAIELVLALNPSGEVKGVRLQRLREPETVARAVQNPEWLGLFRSRTYNRGWELNDLSSLPEEARASAQGIREGVRSLLILKATGDGAYSTGIKGSRTNLSASASPQ